MPPFRAAEHVRKREDFERIYESGTRLPGRLMTMFVGPNGQDVPRLGIAATRKMGSAVERNRAKRLVRELFRHHKPAGGLDIVVVPRRQMLDAPYTVLEAEFLSLFDSRDRRRASRPEGRRQGRAGGHSRL